MRIIGTASVMRHGATFYKEIFPDLADEGLPKVKATAREIAHRFPKRLVLTSSPKPRALGTAMHVMEAYGLPWRKEDVRVEEILEPIDIFDYEMVSSLVREVVGRLKGNPLECHRVWDSFYMKSPAFENGIICESRTSAKGRCLEFLGRLSSLCGADRHVVAVTHIELVGTVVHDWFGVDGEYFGPAEVVHLAFLDDGRLQAEFRGEEKLLKL